MRFQPWRMGLQVTGMMTHICLYDMFMNEASLSADPLLEQVPGQVQHQGPCIHHDRGRHAVRCEDDHHHHAGSDMISSWLGHGKLSTLLLSTAM